MASTDKALLIRAAHEIDQYAASIRAGCASANQDWACGDCGTDCQAGEYRMLVTLAKDLRALAKRFSAKKLHFTGRA